MEKKNIEKENWQRDGQLRVSKIFRKASFLLSVHDNKTEVSQNVEIKVNTHAEH